MFDGALPVAHTAALWGERAVQQAWGVRPADVAEAIAAEIDTAPQMHSTHVGIVQALRELNAAGADPHLWLRAAGRLYVQ